MENMTIQEFRPCVKSQLVEWIIVEMDRDHLKYPGITTEIDPETHVRGLDRTSNLACIASPLRLQHTAQQYDDSKLR
jgi:hypothetical protein